ncbi:AMP-binding protein [Paracoccus tegillarcae]|uniref:3-methylmercaptopropionyl-CoA ligase n=1 Tax=Paracoccus tegillarcae TaxID=1529068 RepID=A0A2K9EZY7_9RHOB|nr:AMP-binding protein [Paracoccus tegillarcae]AUH33662.1 acyl-CoA synthase [Paracoccus tegillarcae]
MFEEPYLAPCATNYQQLTPLNFLRRALQVHADQPAVIWRDLTLTYTEFGTLVRRMAHWLKSQGISRGDVVSQVLGNRPELLAAHFAVPGIGAVLNTVNTRLNADEIAYILDHAQSRLLIGDASTQAAVDNTATPTVALCSAPGAGDGLDLFAGGLAEADLDDAPATETAAISLNYTSGTTGKPKGVVYTHRGAYLNALGNVVALGFDDRTRYLWTLPMFHCNGWTHTWAVTAAGGTHVCLDAIVPQTMVDLITVHSITHMCCAPVVLYMLLEHMTDPAGQRVKVGTGGAAPTPALIARMEELGFEIVHLYGLTESYGPVTLNDPVFESGTDLQQRAKRLARQGLRHQTTGGVFVLDDAGVNVPADGETVGEIALCGNTLMAGYYRDPEATAEALGSGVFRTGDLAVLHPDGEIQIQDRAKDIIISGGENFSSLEVEAVLHQHPDILLAAVVAAPDPKWGETAWAFIEVKSGCDTDPQALEQFCRAQLAGFKRPRKFILGPLPKTATGKVQKFALRQKAKEMTDEQ